MSLWQLVIVYRQYAMVCGSLAHVILWVGFTGSEEEGL